MTSPTLVDLLAALDDIAKRAHDAQVKIRQHEAVNGAAALRHIELQARDTATWARRRLDGEE